MNKDLEIWRFAAEKLKQNELVMLLTVAESSGSSPGRQGFKMMVAREEMRGSIGGGVMEVSLVSLAKVKSKKLKGKNKAEIIEQIHRKNVPNSSGMICSGKQTIILLELNNSHLETVKKIISALETQKPFILQITNSKFQISDLPYEDGTQNVDFHFSQTSEKEFLYEENLGFKQKLFIIGGGHCALALSEIMAKMDFHISLFDDRADLNTLAKNSFVHEKKVIGSYEKIGEFIASGENVYVVVMTLGYIFDEIVIRALFDKSFKYFGVLGSKAKMKTLLSSLAKENFDKEKLARIRTPIGLPINSHTPEEIAVSIAAEIISVKNL